MASVPTSRAIRVFIDSSVLIAAAISTTGSARELLLAALAGTFELWLSPLVLQETERNLRQKSPAALPAFQLFREALAAHLIDPPKALVLRVAESVELKDAPIVAGALHAKAAYLASYDRRHLLAKSEHILTLFGLAVVTPDAVLRSAPPA
jgi:predicted nucleic acid-binding protein